MNIEELIALWLETGNEKIKDKIILSCLDIVDDEIGEQDFDFSDLQDLFQEAILGVLLALQNVEKYQDKYLFKDIARYYIRSRINNYMTNLLRNF